MTSQLHPALLHEASFSTAVASFVETHNRRHGTINLKVGARWIRVRPPEEDEIRTSSEHKLGDDYPLVRFIRVGTQVTVTEVADDWFEIECDGYKLIVAPARFLDTWIPLVPEGAWATRPSRVGL